MGFIIGLAFGVTGLACKNHKTMLRLVNNALLLTFCITVCMGFAGFLYGKFHLVKTGVNWWLPPGLVDKTSFIIVGSIHNFSYLGGLMGIFAGVVYLAVNCKNGYPVKQQALAKPV